MKSEQLKLKRQILVSVRELMLLLDKCDDIDFIYDISNVITNHEDLIKMEVQLMELEELYCDGETK